MPQNAPITIADGAATPVNHTFTPKGPTGSQGEYVFRDTKTGIVDAGQVQLSVLRRKEDSRSVTDKVTLKLGIPKVVDQTTNGVAVQVVQYTNLATVELVAARTSSSQELKDMLAYVANCLKSPLVASVVVDREAIW